MQLWDSWWLEFLELLILPVACGWGCFDCPNGLTDGIRN